MVARRYVLAVVSFMIPHGVAAQLADVHARLKSSVDSVRINTLNGLISEANHGLPNVSWKVTHERVAKLVRGKDSVDVALIKLLERENIAIRRPTPHEEEYTEYYASLIATVAELGDVRAVDGLLGSIRTGTLGRQALVALGAPVVARIEPYMRDRDATVRAGALDVLKLIVMAGKLDAATGAKSKQFFINAIRDTSVSVRMSAIGGLSNYSDDETEAAFRRIAASDPYRIIKDGKPRYPLRDEALKWLRQHKDR